jgi:hypothetical protein
MITNRHLSISYIDCVECYEFWVSENFEEYHNTWIRMAGNAPKISNRISSTGLSLHQRVWLENGFVILLNISLIVTVQNRDIRIYLMSNIWIWIYELVNIYGASYPVGAGGPFPGGKARPGREADHSPPSSAEVKYE